MLSRQLTRLIPDLRAIGIEIGFLREGKECKRVIHLENVVKVSSVSSVSSAMPAKPSHSNDLVADDKQTILAEADDKQTISTNDIVCRQTQPEQHFKALADDTDDTDDKTTPFSKEDEKLKIGDLVKPADPYHGRGQDIGISVSSTPPVSSTYRPLVEPLAGEGSSSLVDDVDDFKTPFSKEDEKLKIGDLVKLADPYHGRGQDIGMVEAIIPLDLQTY
jgi:hypothetical protein